mmetsp:Transcript_24708/g.80813  ORF Transcript_24708/g.80813 Transcript_24708/m.80813 type:complete len:225 (+) Transcript_24708:19-693(+)
MRLSLRVSRTVSGRNCGRSTARLQRGRVPHRGWSGLVRASAEGADDKADDGDSTSAALAKELERRRLSGDTVSNLGDVLGEEPAPAPPPLPPPAPAFARDAAPPAVEEDAVDAAADERLQGQLARSRALQSEGIEGLIPRATELIKLGGASFLSFFPLIAVFSILFTGTYLLFGSEFVHGGSSSSGPPPYVPPEALLAEETYDPFVPLRSGAPSGYNLDAPPPR